MDSPSDRKDTPYDCMEPPYDRMDYPFDRMEPGEKFSEFLFDFHGFDIFARLLTCLDVCFSLCRS